MGSSLDILKFQVLLLRWGLDGPWAQVILLSQPLEQWFSACWF